MRVTIRYMNVEIFLLLIISGYFLTKFNSKYFLLFFVFVVGDNLFKPEFIPRREKAELIKRKEILSNDLANFDKRKYKAVALIDSTQEAYKTNIDMMLVAQSLGIKTVNGYSSNCPDELGEFVYHNTVEGLNNWLVNQKINRDEILLIERKSESAVYP